MVVLCQALLSYSPVGGAEASQQALVVKAAALLAERVLGGGDTEVSVAQEP